MYADRFRKLTKNEAEFERVLVQKLPVLIREQVDLDSIEYSPLRAADCLAGAVMIEVRALVLGLRKSPVEVKSPATWWDHFKLECFPKRLLDWFPASYTVTTVDQWNVFPGVKTSAELLQFFRERKDE